MNSTSQHVRFVWIFIVVLATVLLPVLGLNYLLGMRSLGGGDAVLQASRWQQVTRGVTYAPPLSANRPFKSARLLDRLPEINTVVFGSSTALGITQDMFPAGMTLYNFAQTGNELSMAIGEAEFLQHTYPDRLKWLVIPLDWALGFLYRSPVAPGQVKVEPPGVDGPLPHVSVPLTQQLQDALSLPRVKNLFASIAQIARAVSPAAAFRELFLQQGGSEYHCADGTPARDFDTIFRGTCTGFRYDGSATFANLDPVAPRRVDALIASAVVPSSKYSVDIIRSAGEPNPLVLARLAALARDLRHAGGSLILFLPPLLPGMERAFLESPHSAAALSHTKQVLDKWARAAGLTIIDAGQSERFGCLAQEFVDEHHAISACYARIFTRFWSWRASSKLHAGLYTAD